MTNQLLDTGDMDYVRSEAERVMPNTCHILDVAQGQDGVGGQTEDYSIVYRDVACRFALRRGNEKGIAGREVVEGEWIVTMPYDQNIQERMRIQRGSDVYQVKFVNQARSHYTAQRVIVLRLE